MACPTGSIRTTVPVAEAKDAIHNLFPLAVNEEKNVFYMGFTSKSTFGASAWLVISNGATCLIDCPRYNSALAQSVDRLIAQNGRRGSLDYIFLTHRDDVAGHAEWAKRYPTARRVIHVDEVSDGQGTTACEIQLSFHSAQKSFTLAPGFEVVPVPGHTSGHLALLHTDTKSLFSGDHLAWSHAIGNLTGFPHYNSFSWNIQVDSIAKLADLPWLHLYPGHGRMFHFKDDEERQAKIQAVVKGMNPTQ